MKKQPRKRCELVFTNRVDRVMICPPEDRNPADPVSWIFGFRGRLPENPELGMSPRWVNRYWRIEPRIPGKDAALVALIERATLFGFEVIEVFSLSPPPSKPNRIEIAQLNERISKGDWPPWGEGNYGREGEQ